MAFPARVTGWPAARSIPQGVGPHPRATHIVIPFIGGGLLGSVLKVAGIGRDHAYLVGLLVAVLAAPILFWRQLQRKRRVLVDLTTRREAVERLDTLPTLTALIERIRPVTSEPDWPAYLLQDADRSYALVSSAELAFADPEFARDRRIITVSPPDRLHIPTLSWAGNPIPLEPLDLPLLEKDWPGEGAVTSIEPHRLPHPWKAALHAA